MRVKPKKDITTTIMSIWQKEDKICRIQSTQEGNGTPIFVFRGYNPFPCFNMKSTFTIINKWMKENGWERKPGGYKVVTIDEIDPETGELLWHSSTRETYIPVEKPAEEKTFFVEVEANTKEEAAEVALKSPWHKLGEKPNCEFCLKEFGFPICRECTKERK